MSFSIRNRLSVAGPALVVSLLLVAGCGSKSSQAQTQTQTQAQGHSATRAACRVVSAPKMGARTESKPTKPLPKNKTYDVTIQTNCGPFTFRIDQAQSPNAAASFVNLVQRGFFNQTIFHRIVPGFVIQGGDPTGTGTSGPGYTTIDTPPPTATYTLGVVAMAKAGNQPAGAAGSQFFVVTEPNASLPPDYAIIGKVTKGLDVVERIGRHGNTAQQPTMVIEIQQANVKVS
jgi:peptidyl-prolyl cis-trans isomerase B (cyclophilin B)